jgi:hypothetical protein
MAKARAGNKQKKENKKKRMNRRRGGGGEEKRRGGRRKHQNKKRGKEVKNKKEREAEIHRKIRNDRMRTPGVGGERGRRAGRGGRKRRGSDGRGGGECGEYMQISRKAVQAGGGGGRSLFRSNNCRPRTVKSSFHCCFSLQQLQTKNGKIILPLLFFAPTTADQER